jgi:MFS family permease
MVLVITCGAQVIDNVFMTGINIFLPAIQQDFGVDSNVLQWLISAYTLKFGGFLLLAGVLSDSDGRKNVLCIGMAWLRYGPLPMALQVPSYSWLYSAHCLVLELL